MATNFTKVSEGKYRAEVTLANGRTFGILVKRTETLNPSARGGAYKTRWKAYNGGLYLREFGDTRQEAFDKVIAVMTKKGWL